MPRTKKKFYLPVPLDYTGSDYERYILDKIVNYNSNDFYKDKSGFTILRDHFRKGGSLLDEGYFYNNIDKIAFWKYGKGIELIYSYCRNFLKGRLPLEVEKKVFKLGNDRGIWGNHNTSRVAYKYAKYVVRGRLPEEYEKGCGNANYINFIQSKGIDIDSLLVSNSTLAWHFYKYNFYVSDMVHNAMIAKSMIGDNMAKIYFKQRKRDDKLIKNRLKIMDPTKTVGDLVKDL
jgi:hypothetical protein